MVFTDTHTHLYVEQFDEDRDEVIRRAMDNGITRFFLPSIDSSYTTKMISLRDQYPENVYLMIGLHPTHVALDNTDELEHVKEKIKQLQVHAVGEIGIDLYWETKYLQQQQEAFSLQIDLAKANDLPIVIHCRNSFDEIFEVLEGHKDENLRGIFHCFTGNLEQALKAISFNMKLGIGGVVTYKNAGLDKVLKDIPIENIVLETDSPYLAPVPFRGKRNESSYLIEVAEKVAEIYQIPLEQVAEITTHNSKEVFGI